MEITTRGITVILLGTVIYVAAVFYVLFAVHTTKRNGCYEKYLKDKGAIRSDYISKYDLSSLSINECYGIVDIARQKFYKSNINELLSLDEYHKFFDCRYKQINEGKEFDAVLKKKFFDEISDLVQVEAARREIVEIQTDFANSCE